MYTDELENAAKSRQTASPLDLRSLLNKFDCALEQADREPVNSAVFEVLKQIRRKLRYWLKEPASAPALPLLIALDGRAAAGKSSLAKVLGELLDLSVFHMDDFYLTPERKTKERLAEAGGNVDRERFFSDVLYPLTKRKAFSYHALIPHIWTMSPARDVAFTDMAIVEGAYTLHPLLRSFYRPDLSFFVDVEAGDQIRRIKRRNGEASAMMFQTKWIPLEENYIYSTRPDLFCEKIVKVDF